MLDRSARNLLRNLLALARLAANESRRAEACRTVGPAHDLWTPVRILPDSRGRLECLGADIAK